jgi:hypothetical protein
MLHFFLFFYVTDTGLNKLESRVLVPVKFFQASLIFAGKAWKIALGCSTVRYFT